MLTLTLSQPPISATSYPDEIDLQHVQGPLFPARASPRWKLIYLLSRGEGSLILESVALLLLTPSGVSACPRSLPFALGAVYSSRDFGRRHARHKPCPPQRLSRRRPAHCWRGLQRLMRPRPTTTRYVLFCCSQGWQPGIPYIEAPPVVRMTTLTTTSRRHPPMTIRPSRPASSVGHRLPPANFTHST